MARVTIFHTSDMHNKLTPEYAKELHDLKAEFPGSLMLDSGDAIWSGNVYWRPGGEPVLDLMNSVPYDALCMGNREFHFLGIGVNGKIFRANFPVLSANLRSCKDGKETPVKPYIELERGGAKIIIFGLSVPCITERMKVKKISDFYFEQPLVEARELVPKLRSRCDLLIAMTHIGIAKDRELAERVEGIDMILGGHTHTITGAPEQIGDTYIFHHGFYVHYVGKVDVDVSEGRFEVRSELIPLAKA